VDWKAECGQLNLAHVVRNKKIQYVFFIRAVFSAVFSLTVLSGLLFLLIDFFLVLLSIANKDSFIHSRN